MNNETIARVCHEVNRAYCASLGDHSQLAWEDAPNWQRKSAITGVEFTLANPDAKPSHSHESWLREKERDGWKYGLVKDLETKEHPCFVPYDDLPSEQKAKDYLFQAVVRAMRSTSVDPVVELAKEAIGQFFGFAHLPSAMQAVSQPFGELAATILATLPRNAERTVALRKLLEAKDAAVRAFIFKPEA